MASGERDARSTGLLRTTTFLSDKMETGMVLSGTEVKSSPPWPGDLKDAYGLIKDGELWLLNAHIGPYDARQHLQSCSAAHPEITDPQRTDAKADRANTAKRPHAHPDASLFKNGRVKCEIALAKGKQLWDKREPKNATTADQEAREAIVGSRKSMKHLTSALRGKNNSFDIPMKISLLLPLPPTRNRMPRRHRDRPGDKKPAPGVLSS